MAANSRSFPTSGTPLCTVTASSGGIWELQLHNAPDNRLTPNFLRHALSPALEYIELEFRKAWDAGNKNAALVITGETTRHKFFSNGFDFELATSTPNFLREYYYKPLSHLLTFPMPTVAALNGHCFAGGLGLALCCDWRVMKSDPKIRALTSIWLRFTRELTRDTASERRNEIDFGAPMPSGVTAVLASKLSPLVLRDVMLTGRKYDAKAALEAGIVDEVVDGTGPQLIERAHELARSLAHHSASGVAGMMKSTIHAGVLEALFEEDKSGFGGSPRDVHDRRLKALIESATVAAKL